MNEPAASGNPSRSAGMGSRQGKRLHIAFLGTRGIPACYSGFETFVEELSTRLVEKGHRVTVYNRIHHMKLIGFRERWYRGVRTVNLPTIPSKHLDTLIHTFLSVLHGVFSPFHIVYFCGVGNAPLCAIPRALGKKTLLNVDGADFQREKWGGLGRWYLRFSERIAALLPHVIIADSMVIQERYRKAFGVEPCYIPYGANIRRLEDAALLSRFGLEKNRYILFVSRLVPENGAHLLVEAFRKIETSFRLAVAGDAPYSEEYKKRLQSQADPRVVFTGYLFGKGYQAISSGAYCFVLPSAIEGTRPVLLDQMAFGNCVLVQDSEANKLVVGDAGVVFRGQEGVEGLRKVLVDLLEHPRKVSECAEKALARAKEHFSWEGITSQYEDLFYRLLEGKKR